MAEKPQKELSAVFLGEESLVISCATAWLERGHLIRAVVTDVDDIALWAAEHNLPIVAVSQILDGLRGGEPFDYLFSIVNFKLLPAEVLTLPRHLPINYHDSPLPAYAGVNATNWAIINGEESHAITWHVMTEAVDAGAILEQRFFPIDAEDTALTLNARAYEEALAGFKELTDKLSAGTVSLTEQPTEGRSYFARWQRPHAAGVIDWARPAHDIARLVRGLDHGSYFNPLGRAKLHLGDGAVVVTGVEVDGPGPSGPPGTILEAGPVGFTVAAVDRQVRVVGLESFAGEHLIPTQVLTASGFAAGDLLPSLTDAEADALTQAATDFAPKERYWIRRLVELELLPAPYVTGQSTGPTGLRTTQISIPTAFTRAVGQLGVEAADGLTGAVLMYLARIHNRLEFDVGYRSDATSPLDPQHLFSPTVPLRFSCRGTESLAGFVELFQAARQEAESNLTYALDLIGRAPQLRDATGPFTPPLVIERAPSGAPPSPQLAADLVVRIPSDGAEIVLFAASSMADEDLDRIAEQLATVLADVASAVDQPVGEVDTLPLPERVRLRDEWNSPVEPYALASSLAAGFEAQVRANPDRVALTYLDENLTYRELNVRANRVANTLITQGAGPDVLVGLAMERSIDLLVGLLAILKSGSAYLPLDPTYPPERVRYMVEHAEAPIVLTQNHLTAGLPDSSARIVTVEEAEGDDSDPGIAVDPSNLAYVMYTSGSTGLPKGVQITHRNVLRLMAATDPWFEFDNEDVWVLFHSYAFDFTVWEIWGALLFGGRLVIPTFETTRSPRGFLDLLKAEQVTVLNQTPSAFRQLIEAEGTTDDARTFGLRYVVFGGEALDLADLRPWIDRHGADKPQLVNMYGITETTVHVTYRPLNADDIDRNLGSLIGLPIPDLQIHVLDRWMQLSPIGMPGEIYVGGAGLARGYLHRPELTAERFLPDPFSPDPEARLYRTGDVARYLPSGDLEYLGRADSQIQLRGFRVELGEIEAVISSHEAVSKVIVDVWEQATGDKQLVAYYLSATGLVEPVALRELAADRLPEYMVPHHFVPLDSLPLTPSGKLDRKALPAPPRHRTAGAGSVLPRNAAEREIAGVWERLLDITGVGVDDSFFDLGGDSLSIVRANEQLQTLFGKELTMADMFRLPTVAKLAAYITADDVDAGDGVVEEGVRLAQKRRSRRRSRHVDPPAPNNPPP